MSSSTSGARTPSRAAPRTGAPRAKGKPTRKAAASPRSIRNKTSASKISITVDSAVLDEVRRLIRGTGLSLSAHVSQALERDLRRRRLQQILEEHESESGAISEEELAEVRALWPG